MADIGVLLSAADTPPLLCELGDLLEVGILVLDADLVVRGCNTWLGLASRREAGALVGRPLVEVFPELRGSPAESVFRRALEGTTTVLSHRFHRYLLPLPAPAGHDAFERMQQSARVVPVVRDGRVDGVLVIVQDVTERVARETELRRAMEHSEVASQAKSDFLAAMSHELRTPLSAVLGYVELIAGEIVGPVSAQQKEYLGRVRAATRHLIGVIEEILTFSRVEAGKEVVHAEVVDIVAVTREVTALFESQAVQKGVALTAVVPAESLLTSTDPTKLRQILINLVGNAVKFTEAGAVTLEMVVEPPQVRFVVRDTGPGIPAPELDRIFEPFTQLGQTWRRVSGGTGLGLPVSRSLAQLLGGDVTVQSVPGQGSSFTVLLPLRPHASADEGALKRSAASARPASRAAG